MPFGNGSVNSPLTQGTSPAQLALSLSKCRANREHCIILSLSKGKTLLAQIYGYFIQNPLLILNFNSIY